MTDGSTIKSLKVDYQNAQKLKEKQKEVKREQMSLI